MRLIESKTLTGTQASIEFTSIPQSFTDLVLLCSVRGNSTAVTIYLSFNGSTTNFSGVFLQGTGSTVSSALFSGATARFAGSTPGTDFTANTFANNIIYIPNYSGDTNKSYSVDYVLENSGTMAFQGIIAGLWSNTAAISSLSLTPDSGSFIAGTIVSLYGITKGTDGIVTTSP